MDLYEILSKAGTPGLFMIIVLWLLAKTIPQQQREFRITIKEAHDNNRQQQIEFREMLHRQQESFLRALAEQAKTHSNAEHLLVQGLTMVRDEIKAQTNVLAGALAGKAVKT